MDGDLGRLSGDERVRPATVPLARPGIAGRWGLLLLIGGWEGIIATRALADVPADPSSGGVLIAAAAVVVISVAAIGVGCRVVLTAARSPLRYVFRSRPAFWTAAVLIAAGVVAVAMLIARDPFARVAAHGELTAHTVVELAGIGGALLCLGAGIVALIDCWDAHRDERSWHRAHRRVRRSPGP